MTTAKPTDSEMFDERTLPEPAPASGSTATLPDLHLLDFKDGQTSVTVTHGPIDPSRVCITLRSGQAVLQVSIEETVGREIADGLARVLPTFRAVRSRVR